MNKNKNISNLHISEQAQIALDYFDCKVWAQVLYCYDWNSLIERYNQEMWDNR